jgi:WD40 repeat protein
VNPPPPKPNPFPGLRPFLEHEKHLFFGRERQVAELVDRLGDTRFLAVVGTSGSGKSSLVRAGLLPELHGGNLVRAGSRWEVIVMRPGGGPMVNLAAAFLDGDLFDASGADPLTPILTTLTRSRFGLVEAVRQSDLTPGSNLLVIVDQFEEIFRFHAQLEDGDEHAADFVNLLLEATRQNEVPIYVALTMRSDFLGDCAQFTGLAEAVNDGEYLIPRMNRDQCRLAIEGPVRVGGATIAPRLTQRLLNEIGDNPDQLPVLQHALMRTWDHWAARNPAASSAEGTLAPIDIEDYEGVGGMAEALSRHADEVFLALANDRQRDLAKRLFKALTERGAEARGVRRPERIDRLAEVLDAPASEVLPVIEAFRAPGRTFLMPMHPVELRPSTVVDISHESLMRVWQRLRGWVEEEVQSARIYRRLAETATLQAQGQAGLYRDPDLQIAVAWRDQEMPTAAWAERYHAGFSAAMAFLNASSEAARAEALAHEAGRQRELNQARALAETERRRAEDQARHARRLRLLVRGLAVVTVLAIAATIAAVFARNAARTNAHTAQVKEELARASEEQAKAATKRAESLQREASRQAYASTISLADGLIESGRIAEAEQALSEDFLEETRAWEYGHLLDRLMQKGTVLERGDAGGNATWGADFSPDSRLFAYAWAQREVRVRDLRSGALTLAVDMQARYGLNQVNTLAFSPDGNHLAAASWSQSATNAWLMNPRTGEITRFFAISYPCLGLGFSPDGRWLAVGGQPPEVRVFDVGNGQLVRAFGGHGDAVQEARFTHDGARLITITGRTGPGQPHLEGIARVWDMAAGRLLHEIKGHTDGILGLALHPTAPVLLTAGWDNTVRLWNYETGAQELVLPWRGVVSDLAFGPDASYAVIPSNGHLVVGSATRETPLTVWEQHNNHITRVAISPDGRFLASCSFDQTVKLIDLEQQLRGVPLPAHQRPITALAASPDGSRVATGSWDETVQIRALSGWKLLGSASIGRVPSSIAFSPDSTQMVVPGPRGTLLVLAADSARVFRTCNVGATPALVDAAFSPDGKAVATVGIDGYATVFESATAKMLWRRQVHTYFFDYYPVQLANSIRFSPDGRRLVTAGATDARARVLDAASGEPLGELAEFGEVRLATFSPDGRWILTSSGGVRSGNITRWDATTYTVTRRFQAADTAGVMTFTDDGRRVLTASGNGFDLSEAQPARLWDLDSGRSLITLGGTNRVSHIAVVPGTPLVLGADADGSVTVWTALSTQSGALAGTSTNTLSERLRSTLLRDQTPPPLGASELNIAARLPEGPSLDQLVRQSIQPRPPATSPLLLDLRGQAAGTPSLSAHLNLEEIHFESELAGLSQSVQRINGVLFDTRALLAVANTNSATAPRLGLLKSAIGSIPVGRAFHRLHTLNLHWPAGGGGGGAANQPLARYRLHYADGTEAVVPVLRGRDVIGAVVGNLDTTAAAAANMLSLWGANDRFQRLFHAILENPRPAVAVLTMDLEAETGLGGTLIVAGITLETNAPIRILAQPAASQTVTLGAPVEWSVEARAGVPLEYQWMRDDVEIPGATNATLRLASVTAEHIGSYCVNVFAQGSGRIVEARSAPAALFVSEPGVVRGMVRLDYFDGVRNKFLTNLTRLARFPGNPDRSAPLARLEIPRNQAEDYGARITGLLLPPVTGEYRFFISSDDQSHLFLGATDQPESKQLIAQETHWQSPRAWFAARRRIGTQNVSKPIYLESGLRYYLELHYKEGAVLDHCEVTWQKPGEPAPMNGSPPILGRYLATPPFTPKP